MGRADTLQEFLQLTVKDLGSSQCKGAAKYDKPPELWAGALMPLICHHLLGYGRRDVLWKMLEACCLRTIWKQFHVCWIILSECIISPCSHLVVKFPFQKLGHVGQS